ncbi:MAG: acyltransferase [Patescibacteria group bacterium]
MAILITDALRQNWVVITGLLLALVVSIRRTKDDSFFPPQTTTELKGLAILMVVFSHIGYFLVSDRQFLVPLSNYAGVGVDLFLVLSGYGLVVSALKKPLSIGQFYSKRLRRIYIPVAVTVALFVLLDFFFLHLTYPLKTVIENLLGFFPRADLYQDINSPLWYITPLLAYYLLFPLIFWKRFPAVSAIGMALVGWLFIKYSPQFHIVSVDMIKLYKLHFLSFPLGVALGALSPMLSRLRLSAVWRWLIIILSLGVFAYTYSHSFVTDSVLRDAVASLMTVMAVIALFVYKKINFKILALLGVFSFEIYLLHWPLLYRYNFLYGKIPAGLATLIYLALFLGLGFLYQKLLSLFYPVRRQPDVSGKSV